MRRTRNILLGSAALLAVAAPSAQAASVTTGRGEVLRYTAAPSEASHLRISYDAATYRYVFEDTGASSISESVEGCDRDGAHVVRCDYGSLRSIEVKLGDGGSWVHDELRLTSVKIAGGAAADTITGGGGLVELDGGGGHDTITAGSGTTKLRAGAGGATLIGGSGRSTYEGSPEADTIHSGNGVAESVKCGGGVDHFDADADDTVANDCENPLRSTSGDPTSPVDDEPGSSDPEPVTDPIGPIEIALEPVTVGAGNAVPVEVACPAQSSGGCAGQITLTEHRAAASGTEVTAAGCRRVLGRSKRFRLAAGETTVVPVVLSRRAARIFKGRRFRRRKVDVTVVLQTEAGVKTVTRTIEIKARRRPPVRRNRKK